MLIFVTESLIKLKSTCASISLYIWRESLMEQTSETFEQICQTKI